MHLKHIAYYFIYFYGQIVDRNQIPRDYLLVFKTVSTTSVYHLLLV